MAALSLCLLPRSEGVCDSFCCGQVKFGAVNESPLTDCDIFSRTDRVHRLKFVAELPLALSMAPLY